MGTVAIWFVKVLRWKLFISVSKHINQRIICGGGGNGALLGLSVKIEIKCIQIPC